MVEPVYKEGETRRSIQLGDHIRVLGYIPTNTSDYPILKEGGRYKLSGMTHSATGCKLRFVDVNDPDAPFILVDGMMLFWEWLDRWTYSGVEKQFQFSFMRRPRAKKVRL